MSIDAASSLRIIHASFVESDRSLLGVRIVASLDVGASLRAKENKLAGILRGLGSAAVAYSGGVDSSYLLALAVDVLGPERTLALTADLPLLPAEELDRAREIAARLGATHRILAFNELEIPEVARNDERRCYYCKRARFEALLAHLDRAGLDAVLVHGENVDDQGDYRPGSAAAQELGVRAPLVEAGLSKADIRALSKARNLPTWDQPAAACLATRFPYGATLTSEALDRVERAEAIVRELSGVRQLRVRDHHPVARIEVPPDRIEALVALDLRGEIVARLRQLGYLHVALDLAGYRMGSMNDSIARQ